MIDIGRALEREGERFHQEPGARERLERLRERRRRNQRLQAVALAVAIAIAGLGWLFLTRGPARPVPTDGAITVDNVDQLHEVWRAMTPGDGRFSNVTAADGMVFVRGSEHREVSLFAFPQDCTEDCRPTWRADLGCCHNAPDGPLVMDGIVYVTEGATMFAFDERCGTGGATCRPLWRSTVDEIALFQPVGSDRVVYAGSSGGRLYAFDARCRTDGGPCDPLWTSAPVENQLQLSAVADGLVWGGTLENERTRYPEHAYAFPVACRDGCAPARAPSLGGDVVSRPIVADDLVVLATYDRQADEGTAFAYPISCALRPGCEPVWRGTLPGAANRPDPVVRDGVASFASTGDGFVRAFSLDCTGRCSPMWTAFVFDASFNQPAAADGLFYLPSTTEGLVVLPAACTTHGGVCDPIWTSADAISRVVSGVAVADGRVFVRTTDQRLIALAPTKE